VASTESVSPEVAHLLGRVSDGRRIGLAFFHSAGLVLVPASPAPLNSCCEQVERQPDRPMNYAGSALVALAMELDTDLVLTADHRELGRTAPRNRPLDS